MKKMEKVQIKKGHLVLYGPHPSPKSAYKGFFHNNYFKPCNDHLEKQGKTVIDWSR